MGVIHKLKPEVKDFIIERRKTEPTLGCRRLADLVLDKFQTKVSKSSINLAIKEAGLSMPVGRRRKKRKYTLKLKGLIQAQTKELAEVQESAPPKAPELQEPIPLPKAKLAEAEAKAKAETEEKVKREAEEKACAEAEAKARAEAEEKAKAEAEAKAKAEAEEKARAEAEAKKKAEEEKARREAEEKTRLEAEARARAEAEAKAKEEAERKAREEAEAKAEAEARVKAEAEEKARAEAEEKVRLEVEAKKKAEEEKARREAEEKVRREAEVAAKAKAEAVLPTEISAPGLGAILLKAADCILGGSYYIGETIKPHLRREDKDLLPKIETLLYMSLFDVTAQTPIKEDSGLWPLIDKKLLPESIRAYLSELQSIRSLPLDIARIITNLFQEVRCIKVGLSDGTVFYLDGQLHSIWSTPQIPYDFSSTLYHTKQLINKYFQQDNPLVIFIAPGYETPTKEFFDFILGLESEEKTVSMLTLYGNRFEELETIQLERAKQRFFILGLGPWQFAEYRRVKKIGEFKPFSFVPAKEEFYLAEAEIELLQPNADKRVALQGCVLKRTLNEKPRLVILSNLKPEETKPEDLANIYLNRWPNLEEAFQDFSRKIELFTYTASSQRFFSPERLGLDKESSPDTNITTLFNQYLEVLDLYVRWHFLPSGYEDKDFTLMKKEFYALSAQFKKEKNLLYVNFQPPPEYPFLKDLQYACCRINEREIIFPDGCRLWCNIS